MAQTITIINENETIKLNSCNFVRNCINYNYTISTKRNKKGKLLMQSIKKGKKFKLKLNNVQ